MYPTTLLCLLSDQRMQNVIPLFQRGLSFQRVVMLASAQNGDINPRFAQVAKEMQSALEDRAEWVLYPQAVDPMSPEATRLACQEIISSYGGLTAVTVNFTGGTKPMSIGAFQAGQEAGATLLYVDTQTEKIYRYAEDQSVAEPFNLKPLSVIQLLQVHGRKIDENHTASLQLSPGEIHVGQLILERRPQSFLAPLFLREWLRQAPKVTDGLRHLDVEVIRTIPWFIEALEETGFLERQGDNLLAGSPAVSFIDGGWLEAYVYLALQNSGRFANVAARQKLSGAENELDVACTLNGKLGIIECKGGNLKGPLGQSALNRLRALRDSLGGIFARAFLVTAQSRDDFTNVFRQRAKEYSLQVIGMEDLENVEVRVAEALGSRRR
jgi:hypothetical protein